MVALVVGLATQSYAQLKRFGVKRSVPPAAGTAKGKPAKNIAGRTQAADDTLSLPFWDDFSFTPTDDPDDPDDTLSGYPVDALWQDSWHVWINSGMGINPPSRNVATFDGLDSLGLPYSDQILYNGFRDVLTSNPIKLTTLTTAERSAVYLSFAYQWQGNGEPPDPNDYMRVEFKTEQNTWETVMNIPFRASLDRTVFYDTIVQVNGDRFFHKSFQFRFRNYGRLSGPYDTWNIDYVYLNKGRTSTDLVFPDRAITTQAGSLFEKYRAVPLLHFLTEQKMVPAPFQVYNAQGNPVSVNYLANATLVNYNDGTATAHAMELGDSIPLEIAGGLPSGVIEARQHKTVATLPLPDMSQLDADADSASIAVEIILNSNDNVYKNFLPPIEPDSTGDYTKNFEPIDFRNNDTIRARYNLAKYYAYDDGTAEYSAGLTQAGNRGAYLFEMIIPVDTLVGFDIYFPDYGVVGTVTTDFYVYGDDNGKPGTILYTLASRAIQRKGIDIFQRFTIIEPFLVSGRFYIAWKAPVGTTLQIGLDYSNDSGSQMFFNANGTWEQNIDVVGSLMIRPRFGSGDIVTGIPEDLTRNVTVYPNPNGGTFYITGDVDRVELLSATGQAVPFQTASINQGLQLSAANAAPGLYILRLYKGTFSTTRKVVIR